MRNVSDKPCRQNHHTHFMFNNFFPKIVPSWDGGKYSTARQATDALCMSAKARHTLRICNTCLFSTAAMVTRTRLNVTLYVHCLSCWNTALRCTNTHTGRCMTPYLYMPLSLLCNGYLPLSRAAERQHSPPFRTEINNAWSYTSPAPYAFMAMCLITNACNFDITYVCCVCVCVCACYVVLTPQ